jgi:lipid-A-disaccharide synthase
MLRRADERFARDRPDAVVLIDNPGFNWHVAKAAKRRGIPVIYYVPPQIWAWGTWRVSRMRRHVDHVLCSLPFEEPWYHARGVPGARYVGHPFFDELERRPVREDFLAEQRTKDPRRIVALLPGSRTHEVHGNFPMMVAAAERILRERSDVRFLVAGFKEPQRPILERELAGRNLPVEVHIQRTHEIMRLATTAIAVSGSVSMELMYHRLPTTVIYRVHPMIRMLAPWFMRSRYITLVNLLADRELYPERFSSGDESAALAANSLRWLGDEPARQALIADLDELARRYAAPGATARAAERILEVADPTRRAFQLANASIDPRVRAA